VGFDQGTVVRHGTTRQGEHAAVGSGDLRVSVARRIQRSRGDLAAKQHDHGMAGHLLVMECHRLAAMVLQDGRRREIADAERW
jgi:hypothetical protein